MSKGNDSLLAYYQTNDFNPVHIRVETPHVWEQHFAKRKNLYERHLGIPLSLLKGARILEFGPNSGENCLVPALFGSRLTLVEPNDLVLPRLKELFNRFDVIDQIDAIHCETIDEFTTRQTFDLVVAEGFLYTLPNKELLLKKIVGLVDPGKFGIISINDKYGGLLELLRRVILFQVCRLNNIEDIQSIDCLELAIELYADDFNKINSSRTFDAWWKDTLVNPFYTTNYLWSFPEVLTILQDEMCEFYSSSPVWSTHQHYNWYKNIISPEKKHELVIDDWSSNLAYFLTGLRPQDSRCRIADSSVLNAVVRLVSDFSEAGNSLSENPVVLEYPLALSHYLDTHPDTLIKLFGVELRSLMNALKNESNPVSLIRSYTNSQILRSCWGTAYHYICFQRNTIDFFTDRN
jgi:hypothetical protein